MPILAGMVLDAATLNRIRPKVDFAEASSDLVGAVTDTDVPGATVTFTTETANAGYSVHAVFDYDTTGGGTTTVGTGRMLINGADPDGARATFQVGAATANDRSSVAQLWNGTLGAAGSYTFKLQAASLPAAMELNAIHTRLEVTIYEVI